MEVIDLNIVDPTQFDKDSKYYDPKSKPEKPRWDCVKVKFISKSNKIFNSGRLKILFDFDKYFTLTQSHLGFSGFDFGSKYFESLSN